MKHERTEEQVKRQAELNETLMRVKRGDHAAAEKLYFEITPRFRTYFLAVAPDMAEDLVQETWKKIIEYLPEFTPDPLIGSPMSWLYGIAKGQLKRSYGNMSPQLMRRYQDDRTPYRGTPTDIHAEEADIKTQVSQAVNDLLSDKQRQAVQLLMAGKTYDQVAEELAIKKKSLSTLVSKARAVLEQQLLFPLGLKRVASFEDDALSGAASTGALNAELVLGIYYTSDAAVKEYMPRRRTVDTRLLNVDMLPLAEAVTPQEYQTIIGGPHRNLLIKNQGRLYINRKDLERIKERRQQKNVYTEVPEEGMVALRELAGSRSEYNRLRTVAANEGFPAKRSGIFWFAHPADVQIYLERHPVVPRKKENQGNRGVIFDVNPQKND